MYKANPASVPRSERIIRRATCLAGDLVGRCVRVNAPRTGSLWHVAGVTSATITDQLPATGIIIKKTSPTICFVQFHGTAPRNIYSTLQTGKVYVVGTDGYPATQGDTNYPLSGGTDAFQQIGLATSNDELILQALASFEASPGPAGSRVFREHVSGVINGVNNVFTTTLNFIPSGPQKETVYYNGVMMESGAGNDYVVSESGGPSTGFDTITLAFVPKVGDRIWIDYAPSP